ncbi:DUF5675 family protein [Negadavirga shengliensis]|uniref:DUF5675 family protein n=1 Tax=Negadavirga shengliensis TaxID=1389218 RepID=A0ABV9T7T7_9BACT
MRLLMIRRYRRDGTRGVVTQGHKILALTFEQAHEAFHPRLPCIPEGAYPVSPGYSEKQGWYLTVKTAHGNCPFLPAESIKMQKSRAIAPATFFTAEGKPMFSRLANVKLTTAILEAIEKGEEVVLEIISENNPETVRSWNLKVANS